MMSEKNLREEEEVCGGGWVEKTANTINDDNNDKEMSVV